jgi:hypothetical protein
VESDERADVALDAVDPVDVAATAEDSLVLTSHHSPLTTHHASITDHY